MWNRLLRPIVGLLVLVTLGTTLWREHAPIGPAGAPTAEHRLGITSTSAKFKINSTASSPPGFDATNNQAITLQLEASTAPDIYQTQFFINNPGVPSSPQSSLNAPTLTLSPSSGIAATPTGTVTFTMPASGYHTYAVRCVLNGGVEAATGKVRPEWTFERVVAIRSAASVRKLLPGETTQYSARGWSDEQNVMVDNLAGGGGGGTPPCAVADFTGLRAIAAAARTDNEACAVGSPVGSFNFSTSTGTGFPDDAATIIKPTDVALGAAGRWYAQNGGANLSTLAALRAAVSGKQSVVQVQARQAVGDGGGGIFDAKAGSCSDDDGTIILAGSQCYQRRYAGPVQATWFGATADAEFGTAATTLNSVTITVTGITLSSAFVGRTVMIRGAALGPDGATPLTLTNFSMTRAADVAVAYAKRAFTCTQTLGAAHRGHYIEVPGAGAAGGLLRGYISKIDEGQPQYKINPPASTTVAGINTPVVGGDSLIGTIATVTPPSTATLSIQAKGTFAAADIAILTNNATAITNALAVSDHVEVPPAAKPYGLAGLTIGVGKTLEIKRGGVLATTAPIVLDGDVSSLQGYTRRVTVLPGLLPGGDPKGNIIGLTPMGVATIRVGKTNSTHGASLEGLTLWNKFRTPDAQGFRIGGQNGTSQNDFHNLMTFDYHQGTNGRPFYLQTGMNTSEFHGIWAQGTDASQVEIDGDDETGTGQCVAITPGAVVTVNTGTDLFTSALPHGFLPGDEITFYAPTSPPGGITIGTTYYVLGSASGWTYTTFKVSLTPGGAVVDVTAGLSGTLTATQAISGGELNIQFDKFQLHHCRTGISIGTPGNFGQNQNISLKNGVIEHIGTANGIAIDAQQVSGLVVEGMHTELGAEKNVPQSTAGTNSLDQTRAKTNKGFRLGTDNDISIASGVKVINNPQLGGSVTMFEGISFDGVDIAGNHFLMTSDESGGKVTGLAFWNRGNTRSGSFGARTNIQFAGGNSWQKSSAFVLIDNTAGVLLNIDENQTAGSAPSVHAPLYKFPGTFVGPISVLDGNFTFKQTTPGDGAGLTTDATGVNFNWSMPDGFFPQFKVGGDANLFIAQKSAATAGVVSKASGLQMRSNWWDSGASTSRNLDWATSLSITDRTSVANFKGQWCYVFNGSAAICQNQAGSVSLGTGNMTAGANGVTVGGAHVFDYTDVADTPAGGNIGTAANTVDIHSYIRVAQTTAAQTLTLPNPTTTTPGRCIVIAAGSTAVNFTMYGATMAANDNQYDCWNGSAWSRAK